MAYPANVKEFIKKVTLFLLPMILLFSMLIFFSVYSGEITPLGSVIEKQSQTESAYLFARGVIERETAKYKYLSVQRQRPDILAVGSSRVLELRREMFGDTVSFYNAGSMVSSLYDLADFIDMLPQEYTPNIVTLGLDPWWFDVNHANNHTLVTKLARPEEIYNWKAYIYAGRYIVLQSIKNPSYVVSIFKGINPFDGGRALGLDAIEHGNGFRNDGSRQYAAYITEMRNEMVYVDREDQPFVERIQNGYNPFSFDVAFSEVAIRTLDGILSQYEERGIYIIGVVAPFSSELYENMTNSYYASFMKEFTERMPSLFAAHDFSYFDFSDISKLGIDDVYMLDGLHPSETGAAFMLAATLEQECAKNIIRHCQDMLENLTAILSDPQTTPAEINLNAL